MSILFYYGSLCISLLVMIITAIKMTGNYESYLFGDTEIFVFMCVAIILIALGLISDKKGD